MTAHFNSLVEASFSDVGHGRVVVPRKPGLYRNFLKRTLDVALVILAAPVLVLLVLALSLPSVLRGKNPFFVQRRVGRHGEIFTMVKLKTMVTDADNKLASYLRENPEAREEWAKCQKLRADPRVTSFGRFLRRTSLDEIPQFWNVLRGDMSIVGPRPMLPHQRALYHGMAYYSLKPGITGYWQVSDRHESEFSKRVEFDERYDNEVSLITDIVLIIRTFGAVLRGTGA